MKKIYLSMTNNKIAEICGGVGEICDVAPILTRQLLIGFTLIGVFPFVIGYKFAWWIVPLKSDLT